VSEGELRDFHDYLASRYRFQTTDQYRHLLATFRNQHASDGLHALRRLEELASILELLHDCYEDFEELRRDF
jgi:hypothetical protein